MYSSTFTLSLVVPVLLSGLHRLLTVIACCQPRHGATPAPWVCTHSIQTDALLHWLYAYTCTPAPASASAPMRSSSDRPRQPCQWTCNDEPWKPKPHSGVPDSCILRLPGSFVQRHARVAVLHSTYLTTWVAAWEISYAYALIVAESTSLGAAPSRCWISASMRPCTTCSKQRSFCRATCRVRHPSSLASLALLAHSLHLSQGRARHRSFALLH